MRTKVICVYVYEPRKLIDEVEELQHNEGWEIKEIIPVPTGSNGRADWAYVVLEQPVTEEDFEAYRARLVASQT